jgi:hypothetical protein
MGNVFIDFIKKCSSSYLMFIIIVFHYLQELLYVLVFYANVTIFIKY